MALQSIGGVEAKSGISRLTTEFIYWHLVTDEDFSGGTVEMAFMEVDTQKPSAGDWHEAELVDNPDNPSQRSVRILIGPADGLDGVDLSPTGTEPVTYRCWVRIATLSERLVRRAGTLTVR